MFVEEVMLFPNTVEVAHTAGCTHCLERIHEGNIVQRLIEFAVHPILIRQLLTAVLCNINIGYRMGIMWT